MPDPMSRRHAREAREALLKALEHLMRLPEHQRPDLPRTLREVAAAGALVEMAKELERDTVRVARGSGARAFEQVPRTVTGGIRGPDRYSWAAIGAAVGITAQSAHERWARRISDR